MALVSCPEKAFLSDTGKMWLSRRLLRAGVFASQTRLASRVKAIPNSPMALETHAFKETKEPMETLVEALKETKASKAPKAPKPLEDTNVPKEMNEAKAPKAPKASKETARKEAKETNAPKEIKEPKEPKASKKTAQKETKAPMTSKDSNAPKEIKEPEEATPPKKTKASKATKEPKTRKETTAPQDAIAPHEANAPEEAKEPKETKAPKATKASKAPMAPMTLDETNSSTEAKEPKAPKAAKAPKEARTSKEPKDPKAPKEPKARKETKKAASKKRDITDASVNLSTFLSSYKVTDLKAMTQSFGLPCLAPKAKQVNLINSHIAEVAAATDEKPVLSIDIGFRNLGYSVIEPPTKLRPHSTVLCAEKTSLVVENADTGSFCSLTVAKSALSFIENMTQKHAPSGWRCVVIEKQYWSAFSSMNVANIRCGIVEASLVTCANSKGHAVAVVPAKSVATHWGIGNRKGEGNYRIKKAKSVSVFNDLTENKFQRTGKPDDVADSALLGLAWCDWWWKARCFSQNWIGKM